MDLNNLFLVHGCRTCLFSFSYRGGVIQGNMWNWWFSMDWQSLLLSGRSSAWASTLNCAHQRFCTILNAHRTGSRLRKKSDKVEGSHWKKYYQHQIRDFLECFITKPHRASPYLLWKLHRADRLILRNGPSRANFYLIFRFTWYKSCFD
jgi:hypothetical protein